ncbi:hypothetical protein RirG_196890 [Rhizophagus irregularis DAOM 197198w]|uniref:Uncharacterized protein n=1 Tax=Rhizophagus irregularis (strain DAOM 197198w) TaxID=1432141 RepID=A0A015LVB0_RHIIW|nr:hypothetical protein RirG_196890 [Rhizophagus irregularis DAOM 197198w]
MSELRKNMREALQFTDNNTILARFILELRKVATGRSTRYRENIQITERPCNKKDYTELNKNSRSQHLPHRGRCRIRDDTSKTPSSERESLQ